jgi:hypothetical protein
VGFPGHLFTTQQWFRADRYLWSPLLNSTFLRVAKSVPGGHSNKCPNFAKPFTLVAILLKLQVVILLMLAGQCKSFGQVPNIVHSFLHQDSLNSPLIDSFSKKYDFVLAYMEQASPNHNYKILALKNKKWSCWTFSDYFIQLKKVDSSFIGDTIKLGRFWKIKNRVTQKMANEILTIFNKNEFWALKNDSLKQYGILGKYYDEEIKDTVMKFDMGCTDRINYRFEAYTTFACRVIQSYDPDYFHEKYPYMLDRKKFIICKDAFSKWWEKYCH